MGFKIMMTGVVMVLFTQLMAWIMPKKGYTNIWAVLGLVFFVGALMVPTGLLIRIWN